MEVKENPSPFSEKSHVCGVCGKCFSSKGTLNRHLSVHDEKNNTCSYCDKAFARSDVLNRHVLNIHKVVISTEETDNFQCSFCSKSYQYRKTLLRHVRDNHGENVQHLPPNDDDQHHKPVVCVLCDETFKDIKSLKQHVAEHCASSSDESDLETKKPRVSVESHERDSPEISKTGGFPCQHCSQSCSTQFNLNRHVKAQHPSLVPAAKMNCSCPQCGSGFLTCASLTAHLCERHDYMDDMEEIVFGSMEEFIAWKTNLEESSICCFVKHQSAKAVSSGQRHYYVCHRSGVFCTRGSGKRVRRRDTVKIGSMCPARMVVTKEETHIRVSYHKNHFGHENSIAFLKLSEAERRILSDKLKQGVTFEKILDDIRDTMLCDQSITRLGLTERRDLWNLLRTLGLKRNRAHNNDALSVDIIVNKLREDDANNPILLYKPQDRLCDDPLYKFQDEDFMIVVSTPYQRQVLSQFMDHRVLVDSTHGTNGYDFQLTSLVSIDEFGCGVPVAYCLSNRIDTDSMMNFFSAVKQSLGRAVASEVFMSDCAEQYYNAWVSVMGSCEHQLHCTWHVDRCWRGQLKKIQGQEEQLEVYRACRVLLTMADKDLFLTCLHGFVQMLLEDENTVEFGSYFQKQYAAHPEKWAFCFRAGLGLNTNMFLEALHKKLKYMYMHGKQLRRVDECLNILLRFTRDLAFERLTRHCKGNNSYRQLKIVASHKRSLEIESEMVSEVKQGLSWEVRSQTKKGIIYSVNFCEENSCLGCELACPRCRICIHQYKCTCENHRIQGNICKHVHACVRVSERQSNQLADSDIAAQVQNEMESIMETVSQKNHDFNDVGSDLWKPVASQLKYLIDKVEGSDDIMKESLKYLEVLSKAVPRKTMSSNVQLVPGGSSPSTPSNKCIEVQRKFGFHSTKKTRVGKVESALSLPTHEQHENVLAFFIGQSAQ